VPLIKIGRKILINTEAIEIVSAVPNGNGSSSILVSLRSGGQSTVIGSIPDALAAKAVAAFYSVTAQTDTAEGSKILSKCADVADTVEAIVSTVQYELDAGKEASDFAKTLPPGFKLVPQLESIPHSHVAWAFKKSVSSTDRVPFILPWIIGGVVLWLVLEETAL